MKNFSSPEKHICGKLCLHFAKGEAGPGAAESPKIPIYYFGGSTVGKRWHAVGSARQRYQCHWLLLGHD